MHPYRKKMSFRLGVNSKNRPLKKTNPTTVVCDSSRRNKDTLNIYALLLWLCLFSSCLYHMYQSMFGACLFTLRPVMCLSCLPDMIYCGNSQHAGQTNKQTTKQLNNNKILILKSPLVIKQFSKSFKSNTKLQLNHKKEGGFDSLNIRVKRFQFSTVQLYSLWFPIGIGHQSYIYISI